MGVEAYGLVGIYASLQILSGLLDMGVSGTLNREMARFSVLPDREQEMRNLVRSLEIIYWGIALIIGIAVIAISPFIAHYWVRIALIKNRMSIIGARESNDYEIIGMPQKIDDLKHFKPFEFQYWAINEIHGTGSPVNQEIWALMDLVF
jgi:hypothetical protein